MQIKTQELKNKVVKTQRLKMHLTLRNKPKLGAQVLPAMYFSRFLLAHSFTGIAFYMRYYNSAQIWQTLYFFI
jgi:hypothetical protein